MEFRLFRGRHVIDLFNGQKLSSTTQDEEGRLPFDNYKERKRFTIVFYDNRAFVPTVTLTYTKDDVTTTISGVDLRVYYISETSNTITQRSNPLYLGAFFDRPRTSSQTIQRVWGVALYADPNVTGQQITLGSLEPNEYDYITFTWFDDQNNVISARSFSSGVPSTALLIPT